MPRSLAPAKEGLLVLLTKVSLLYDMNGRTPKRLLHGKVWKKLSPKLPSILQVDKSKDSTGQLIVLHVVEPLSTNHQSVLLRTSIMGISQTEFLHSIQASLPKNDVYLVLSIPGLPFKA